MGQFRHSMTSRSELYSKRFQCPLSHFYHRIRVIKSIIARIVQQTDRDIAALLGTGPWNRRLAWEDSKIHMFLRDGFVKMAGFQFLHRTIS